MRLLRQSLVLSAAALLSPAFAPAPAWGSDASASRNTTVKANFRVHASNGYTLSISAYGDEVSVTTEGVLGQAEYTVPGRVTPDGVWASFGRLGRIAVEFRPSGSFNRRVPPDRCEGRARMLRFGTFAGTIRFAGENRYTVVDVHRGRGNSYAERRWDCAPRKRRGGGRCRPEEDDERDSVSLEASSGRHRASLTVFADRSPDEAGFTLIIAESEERRRRMEIRRSTFASGADSIFTYVPALTLATLSPPRPFSGVATYRRGADGTTSWTGDLRVSLPGAPDLALAGPSFEADLRRPKPGNSVVCFDMLAE